MAFDKRSRRNRIKFRVRSKVRGTQERPRLSVYKSNKNIYCQIINDDAGITLASASSKETGLNGSKKDVSLEVGKLIAEKAKANKLENVVFDRNGYVYHGRVKALADGAREGGLNF